METLLDHTPATAIQTPYLRAATEWSDRIGSQVKQARNWRAAFFGALVMALGLLGVIAYLVSLNRYVPVIVRVEESGRVLPAEIADVRSVTPREVQYFLAELIKKIRTVPADPVVVRRQWGEAAKLLTPEAAAILNQLTGSELDNSLHSIGEKTTSVSLKSIQPIDGTSGYQIRWVEEQFSKGGQRLSTAPYSGMFTVDLRSPGNDVLDNPLGIFVTSLSISKDLQ